MPLKKQEFYEGAALHLLAKSNSLAGVRYEPPFFVLNDSVMALLKYSTRKRSPWAFTFTPREQDALAKQGAVGCRVILGLICGHDGIAAITVDQFFSIAPNRNIAVHIACYRNHGEYFGVNGPNGSLEGKVPPSAWQRILMAGVES